MSNFSKMVNKRKGSRKNKIVKPPSNVQLIRKGCNKKRSLQGRTDQNHVKNFCMSTAMSTWAQHFSEASTWQLKHQLAYWKARAISLQYENTMLHEVIRNNRLAVPTTSDSNRAETEYDSQESDAQSEDSEDETERNDIETESDNVECENNEEFEVSEEFIQFLTANAKYKEDARRERERLRAKFETESKPELQESVEDKISQKKELYGDNYKRVMALEMYLMSNFQNEMDKNKATYWPNIPFNFNVS